MLNLFYSLNPQSLREALYEKLGQLLQSERPVLVFVPDQQVLETEGALSTMDGGHLGEVSSFARMANTVFRRFGGLRYHYIGKGAKQIVMWRALQSVSQVMKEYREIPIDDMATVRLLYDTVAELMLYRVTPEDLEKAAAETEDEKFRAKLSDIATLYAAYTAILSEEHDDAAKDLDRATALCEGKGVFAGYHIVLDSFDGFTPDEIDFMRVLFKDAEEITVTLLYDRRDRRDFFEKLADKIRQQRGK